MSGQALQHAIGVDLGGTKIELGIVDQTGNILLHQRLDTHVKEGPAAVEAQILESIRYLQQQMNIPIRGIGVGVAGQIDPEIGEVIFAPNLKWHNVPLQANMASVLGLPVRVVNDVRAITWGEWLYGAGQGCADLICVFIGTGIGGGVVSGGRLLTGSSNTLGEIGHMTVDFHGPRCTCGNHGCLEVYAAGWGVAARAKDVIEPNDKKNGSRLLLELVGQQIENMTAKIVVQAYRQGDPLAQQIIEQAKNALISGLVSIINGFNPQRIILGGGFMDGMPELVEEVNLGVRSLALKAATQKLEIVKAKLTKEAGIVGAAAVIFNLLREQGEKI